MRWRWQKYLFFPQNVPSPKKALSCIPSSLPVQIQRCAACHSLAFPPKKGSSLPSSYPHLPALLPVSLHPAHPGQILRVQSGRMNKSTGTPIPGNFPFPEIIHQHMSRDLLIADRAKDGGHQILPQYWLGPCCGAHSSYQATAPSCSCLRRLISLHHSNAASSSTSLHSSSFLAECPSALFRSVIPVQFLPRLCVPAIKRQTEYGCRPEGRLAHPFDDSPPVPS